MNATNDPNSADGFSTERLDVVHWIAEFNDRQAKLRLANELDKLLTPPVLEHLPEPLQLQSGPDAALHWISARRTEADTYTVRHRNSGELLGLAILADVSEDVATTTIHIGYLFGENAWGQGFATEMLNGVVDWKLDHSRTTVLMGGVGKENPASARVLEKAGFERSSEQSTADIDMFVKVLC